MGFTNSKVLPVDTENYKIQVIDNSKDIEKIIDKLENIENILQKICKHSNIKIKEDTTFTECFHLYEINGQKLKLPVNLTALEKYEIIEFHKNRLNVDN